MMFQPRSLPVTCSTARRGLVIPVVAGGVLVLLIIVYALFGLSTNRYGAVWNLYEHTRNQFVATSLAEYIFHRFSHSNDFRMYSGRIMNSVADGRETVVQPFRFTDVGFLLQPLEMSELDVQGEITLGGFEPLHPSSDLANGIDPGEMSCRMDIAVRLENSLRPMKAVLRDQVLLVSKLMPVTGKFTLFSPDVCAGNARNDFSWNQTDLDFFGGVLGDWRPLRLDHQGGTPETLREREDWQRRGWVFLNAGPTRMILNIAGGMEGSGEYFQFWDPRKQASLVPQVYETTPSTLNTPRSRIKIMPFGFYANLYQDLPDMFHIFEQLKWPLSASALQLFGDNGNPSRTRILGNVHRAFPVMSILAVDVNADGVFTPGLESVHLHAIPREDYPESSWLAPLPANLQIVDAFNFSDIFQDYDEYYRHMSRMIVEPYAQAYDYMEKPDAFPPWSDPQYERVFPAADYEGDNFRNLELTGWNGRVFFRGDLSQMDPTVPLARRISRSFTTRGFQARYLEGNQLRLQDVVRLTEALDLPSETETILGGIILAEKRLSMQGVLSPGGEPLTVVARDEVVLNLGYSYENLFIVALGPSARIRFTGTTNPLRFRGGIAATCLRPEQFRGGGVLTWAPEFDPTSPGYGEQYIIRTGNRREKLF